MGWRERERERSVCGVVGGERERVVCGVCGERERECGGCERERRESVCV